MKVALVHDYIKEYGGAERVLEALHEIWPSAPIFTTVYLPEFLGPHKERFKNWDIKTSIIQLLPFKAKLISLLRIIAPLLFRAWDFSEFDVVIVSSTGAYSKILNTKYEIHNTVQVVYCHTPPRYLYGYATARNWKKTPILSSAGVIANHFLRLLDFKSAQNVDSFIANSINIKNRIKKFYGKNSVVIYPPVGGPVAGFPPASAEATAGRPASVALPLEASKRSGVGIPSSRATPFYLAGGRIAKPKHIDLIIKTFEELDLPLKVFGRGFAGAELKSKSKNIEFVGEISDEEKLELMKNAKAFVFAAEDEDFGITPVEAMSVGTPVIAYRSGGVVESVVHGKTGLFFDELSVESLSAVIKQFNNLTIDPKDCIEHAQQFSKERFKKEIKEFVAKAVKAI